MGFKLPSLSFVSSEQGKTVRVRPERAGVFVHVTEEDCDREIRIICQGFCSVIMLNGSSEAFIEEGVWWWKSAL